MTRVVGICGASGSGKSSIANYFREKYEATVLCQDDYSSCDFALEKGHKNRELLHLYDVNSMLDHIEQLQSGLMLVGPKNLKTGKTKEENITTQLLKPSKLIIAEGFNFYLNERILNLANPRIFLDVSDDEIIRRKVLRSGPEKEAYAREIIVPYHKKAERFLREASTHIIDANRPIETVQRELEDILKQNGIIE